MASDAALSPPLTKSETQNDDSDKVNFREISEIKSSYPGRCRVINDSGYYKYIITIQPENLDATIKFQLRNSYPSTIPDIAVRSSSLSNMQCMEIRNALLARAKELIGKQMVQELMQKAQEMLVANGLKPGKVGQVDPHTVITNKMQETKRKGQKKKKRTPKYEDEVEEEKKKSMKTADDVIKRILWDESLDKDDFIVGYIDRFRGLVEKYFSAFSWEDLASVDYDVLAIPRHRIQFFKYKTVKVWDKPRRIDNVFGSAEGKQTIDIVIKELDELEGRNLTEEQNMDHSAELRKGASESSTEDSEDDSDDEDDIIVTIGSSVNICSQSGATTEIQKESLADGDDAYNPYWRDILRPNYFVCVRITDPSIIDHTAEVHDYLMEKEPLLGECCIPGASLHVTLCTLGLDTAEQLLHCMNTFKKMKDELKSILPKSSLRLHGVSHFYNRVIYAKVKYSDDFIKFCDAMKLNLLSAGLSIRDGYEFVPHMTIMKTTRPVSRRRGNKNIDPLMYEPFLEKHFGEQKIDSICLCSMSTERREDGFYMTPLEMVFD